MRGRLVLLDHKHAGRAPDSELLALCRSTWAGHSVTDSTPGTERSQETSPPTASSDPSVRTIE